MTVPDTSVLVAGADPAHPFFDQAADALAGVRARGRLVAHTMAETYSVLSSAAYDRPNAWVIEYLTQFLQRQPLGVAPRSYPARMRELAEAGIRGGGTYDGLIAMAARDAGASLASLDRRAARTYERCGVEFELLE